MMAVIAQVVMELLKTRVVICNIEIHADLAGIERFALLIAVRSK